MQVMTVCCLIVNATGEKLPLPFAVDRQSRQVYVVPPPSFNYYNPYGAPILVPTAQGELDATLSEDDSEVTGRQSSETISITPVDAGKVYKISNDSCLFLREPFHEEC